jgi:hypothetical protein
LRELPARVTLAAIEALGIRLDSQDAARLAAAGDLCETFGWVRPRLVGGRPVLFIQWSEEHDAWVPVDRKKSEHVRDGAGG